MSTILGMATQTEPVNTRRSFHDRIEYLRGTESTWTFVALVAGIIVAAIALAWML